MNNRKHNKDILDNYREPTDGKFYNCTSNILKNLVAEHSSGSKTDTVEDNWWTESNKELLNMNLRHVGIKVRKQQLEFHY